MKREKPLILFVTLFVASILAVDTTDWWQPTFYVDNAAVQHSLGYQLIAQLPLQGTEAILDIGCGEGTLTAYLAESVPQGRVVGIDQSEKMVRFAQKKYASTHPNLTFYHADACSLSLPETFDYVVSFNCIQWIQDQQAALNGIYDHLKFGGKALLTVTADDYPLKDSIDNTTHAPAWYHYCRPHVPDWVYFQNLESFKELLLTAGFRILSLECKERSTTFTRQSLKDFIKTWLPHLHYLPKDYHEAFLDDIVNDYVKIYPPDKQGRIPFGGHVIIALVEK